MKIRFSLSTCILITATASIFLYFNIRYTYTVETKQVGADFVNGKYVSTVILCRARSRGWPYRYYRGTTNLPKYHIQESTYRSSDTEGYFNLLLESSGAAREIWTSTEDQASSFDFLELCKNFVVALAET